MEKIQTVDFDPVGKVQHQRLLKYLRASPHGVANVEHTGSNLVGFSALRERLVNKMTGSVSHLRIARGMGLVGVFVLIGKFAGAGKEMAVAYRYGVSEIVDVYVLAFTLLTLAPMIWTVVLAMTFVPLSKRLSDSDRLIFTQQLAGLSLLLGGFFAFVCAFFLPLMVPVFWSGYSIDAQLQLKNLFIGLAPTVLALFLSSLFAAQLLALERHSNTLLDGVPSLALALVVLMLPTDGDSSPFIIGGLLGVFLQLLGLTLILRHCGELRRFKIGFSAEAWRPFADALGFLLLAQFVMSLTTPLDLLFAAELGTGTVATYGYAQRLLMLAMTLGATAVGRAILPVLSDADRSRTDSVALSLKWSNGLLWLGLVAVIVGWFVSPLLVKLLFERGAFNATDTARVSHAVRFGLMQIPVYVAGMVLTQFAVSQRYYSWLLHCAFLAFFVKLLSGWILSRYFGLTGVFISSVLMYSSTFLYLRYRMRHFSSVEWEKGL